MTTIAYKDGVLAADSATSGDGIVVGHRRKIERIRGQLVGAAGPIEEAEAFREWLKRGGRDKDRPEGLEDEFAGIVVERDGRVVEYGKRLIPFGYEAPFYAIGSGAAIATGAMAAGSTATEAVKIACRFDHYSEEPVHTLRLDEEA